jgi:hypothetical protein
MIDIASVIDLYEKKREERFPKLQRFWQNSGQKFLVIQRNSDIVWDSCMTIERSYAGNVTAFTRTLDQKSDCMPFFEPWFGTGVYANAYGCKYHWREGDSPAVHYKYHSINEVKDLPRPAIEDSEVMKMVLDAIEYFKEKTKGRLPISCTDTQSAFDTATLILDASELFVSCYEAPEIVMQFMKNINSLIIDFSRKQAEMIGDGLVAWPGHLMMSDPTFKCIGISDDNLAVASPHINEQFPLPVNQELGEAMGGVAIHSCGNWTKTMELLKNFSAIKLVECAVSKTTDTTPNDPAAVRDALRGSGLMLKVRVGYEEPDALDRILDNLIDGETRVVVELKFTEDRKKNDERYHRAVKKLESLYQG